ncbi:hypothetical protein F4561_006378 [Lipingzhangella halophila]|uniref:Uncharacterized protein n=1 Tax=Lipingzhangella halophila TaxID=1783352 RepID=A0A7W7RNX5_9ACTN|nr:hypothetical protein [Lipingzhangella halophila]MBB4935484.1 hypothetical protein [Lipingzhangella halophila]
MSFENIFNGGANESGSAEQTARDVHTNIPGATDTSHIVRQKSPEALTVMNYISSLFQNSQEMAGDQRQASQNPASTAGMAASAKGAASENMHVTISEDDLPEPPERADLPDRQRPEQEG